MGLLDFHRKDIVVPRTEAQQAQIAALYADYPEMPFISKHRDVQLWLDAVVKDTGYLVPKRHMERLAGNVLPGDVIVLWRVQFGTVTNETIMPQYFEYNYGIDAYQSIQDLIAKGYVRIRDDDENLTLHRLPELKAMLKTKFIKIPAGAKKQALIDLIKTHFTAAELADHLHIQGYQITPAGEQLLETHAAVVAKHPKKKY